jgi:hypothetical protein
MKILHIGMAQQPAFIREMSKLGGYRFLDWTEYIDMGMKAQMLTDIRAINRTMEPEVTFLHLQRSGVIDPEFAKEFKGLVVNWTYDVLDPLPDWYFKLGIAIDLTLFCNDEDVKTFDDAGYDAEYLQIGYDPIIFKPDGEALNEAAIVFMGNNYHAGMNYPLTNFRAEMVDFLKLKYGDTFKVYGNNWSYKDGNVMYNEEKEASIYRGSKIGINVSHFDRSRYTSDRMYRIMGCGTFCLTKWYPKIEEDFTDGVHLRVWRTLDELQELIDYYLAHPEEREAIAARGQRHVLETCTWEKRMHQFRNMAQGRMGKEYKSRVVKVAQQIHIKTIKEEIIEKSPIEEPKIEYDIPVALEDADGVSNEVKIKEVEPAPEVQLDFTPGLIYLEEYRKHQVNYEALKSKCYLKSVDNFENVNLSVIIPVRSRTYFNPVLTRSLQAAAAELQDFKISITFVEHSDNMEHEPFCETTNYIHIPAQGQTFNKCLAFNAGFLFGNKANFYMFHDLDIVVDNNFFVDLLFNLQRVKNKALQTFRQRRVLYCNEDLTQRILDGQVSVNQLHLKYPGIHEPDARRAPGGSILVSRDQFIRAGGYDPELFYGYSIEDQFFYDKLLISGGIIGCEDPAIEVYHLWHPPLWNSNPDADRHAETYLNFAKSSMTNRLNFLTLESNHLRKFL